jgi:hypothetical protein
MRTLSEEGMAGGADSRPLGIKNAILAIVLILVFVFAAFYFVIQKGSVENESYEVSSAQTPWGWYFWLDGKVQFVEQVKTNGSLYLVHFWKPSVSLMGRHDVSVTINADMQFLVVHFIVDKRMWLEVNSSIGGRIDLYLPNSGVLTP